MTMWVSFVLWNALVPGVKGNAQSGQWKSVSVEKLGNYIMAHLTSFSRLMSLFRPALRRETCEGRERSVTEICGGNAATARFLFRPVHF